MDREYVVNINAKYIMRYFMELVEATGWPPQDVTSRRPETGDSAGDFNMSTWLIAKYLQFLSHLGLTY